MVLVEIEPSKEIQKNTLNYRNGCDILSPDKEIKVELQEELYGKGSIC